VVGVENYGASDLLEVELVGGKRVLVPLVPDAVTEVGAVVRVMRAWVEAV
jgi:ribosomal 30S subunit maturation factor RimM